MAKTIIVKQKDGDRVRFLKGILVQSLVNTGLSFDEAYRIEKMTRAGLGDIEQISSSQLKERAAKLLEKHFGKEKRLAYESKPAARSDILVHTPARSAPFSVGILAHSLEACAIPRDTALQGARRVYISLRKTGHKEIDHKALRHVIYQCLREHCSQDSADRYLSWRKFEHSGDPLILLIGGSTGSGKSTIASEIAYHTNIARIQSTDMMREVIRAYLTSDAAPTLGYSSFEAWRGLRSLLKDKKKHQEKAVVDGFLSQLATMRPAIEAAIARAVKEGDDLILEGIHVLPSELDLGDAEENAIVVPVMIATLEQEVMRKRLKHRGRETKTRAAGRYLEYIDDIWELQSYLLNEADKLDIPIVANWQVESSVREILYLISDRIMNKYPAHKGTKDL